MLLNRLLAKARFRHVQVLLQLAELGSVRRAAEAIGMTQPGVTQLLAELERLLETPLFQRHARGVHLTPAGSDLLPMARQMMLSLSTSAEAAAARNGQGEGVVRVVATTAGMNGLLLQAIAGFSTAHPGVQVHLQQAEIDDSLMSLSRGAVDLVACRSPAVVPEGWAFHALSEDEFIVACGPAHPLLRKRRVGLKDLARATWLPAPAASMARRRFDALAAQFDQPPAVCQVITRVPAATWTLLQERELLTVVPLSVMRHMLDAGLVGALRLEAPMPMAPLGMLLPLEERGRATQTLASYLQQQAQQENGLVPAARLSPARPPRVPGNPARTH